ncbi:MAG: 4-hydroxy-3-methylbut-2-enyl diphosphate reductase [Candidatus Omnitrophica bacterium CG07_land_8_20_14_0_80_50_8]|nr:MAG: 4-hydroxy-3-methylbut-2-enyl diphosphate reductase [Candidatus Omnitrophica bacterium CG07_land_8_20_14_0_80_50_8]
MTENSEIKKLPNDRVIKKLSEFGEGFKYHHENYGASFITAMRDTGGRWDFGDLVFHFPEHFGFCYGVDKAIDMMFETCERFSSPPVSPHHTGVVGSFAAGGPIPLESRETGGGVSGHRIFLTDQLIHNPTINDKLKEKGVHYLKRDLHNLLICDELRSGDIVVVSAFGTDFRDIESLKNRGVTIVDSTCGAIINVWKRVEGYAKNGYLTVMHGKRNHEETRATVSQAVKKGGDYIIIENSLEAEELAQVIRGKTPEADFIKKYPQAVPENFSFDAAVCKMGMANQTTMLKGESLRIQEILKKAFQDRFGETGLRERFKSFDTICGATQDRQDALRNLFNKPLDLLMIVGGFNSSNTSHLAEIAQGAGGGFLTRPYSFYHIESVQDIMSRDEIRYRDPQTGKVETRRDWFQKGIKNIGVTSGASTPDVTLLEIIRRLAILKRAS